MALPQICCRALVDTHVLRYLYCGQLSQLLILTSLSLRDRNLIKRKFSFYFDVLFLLVWLVCLVEEEDWFLSNHSFRKSIFTNHYFFFVFCFFFTGCQGKPFKLCLINILTHWSGLYRCVIN